MRLSLFVLAAIATFALSGAAHAQQNPPAAPRFEISVLSVGSWRAGDFLRVRVAAPELGRAQLQGRSVALQINGVTVGSRPMAEGGPRGGLYADFSAPWQGLTQTALSATLVDTPPDAAMAEADTLIVLPD